MSKIKILLVSVGSLVGKNLLEIINHSREDFYLIGTNSISEFDSLAFMDEFRMSPLSKSIEIEEFLERLIHQYDPDLIVPCRDEEVVVLARIAERIQALQSKISITNPSLAENFLDKYKSSLLCKELGLPFATTVLLKDNTPYEFRFPIIVKPREGFASRGVKVIFSEEQLKTIPVTDQEYIGQEYLSENPLLFNSALSFQSEGFPLHFSFEEDKYSIQLAISDKKVNSTFFIGKHLMKNGISYEVSRYNDSCLEELAINCLQKFHRIGLRGPLNIQLQRSLEGEFKIFEFNCRFTGATSARFYIGFNELELLLLDKVGKSPFNQPVTSFSKARKVLQTIGIE